LISLQHMLVIYYNDKKCLDKMRHFVSFWIVSVLFHSEFDLRLPCYKSEYGIAYRLIILKL